MAGTIGLCLICVGAGTAAVSCVAIAAAPLDQKASGAKRVAIVSMIIAFTSFVGAFYCAHLSYMERIAPQSAGQTAPR